jgi:hypothetical protein
VSVFVIWGVWEFTRKKPHMTYSKTNWIPHTV